MDFENISFEEKLLHESVKSRVLLRKDQEGKKVLVKVLNIDFPTPEEINQFYNEFEILQLLDIAGVRKPLERKKESNRHVMLFEYIEGPNLKEAFKNKINDLEDFLYISMAICKHFGEIHLKNVLHLDINPFNIIVNLQKRDVKIIDFGNSSSLDVRQGFTGNPEKLRGNLSYISPEQTGRMNRIVDYRSDLYSMGICFYEMLTGKLPFEGKEAIELVHAHIAQLPKPPHEINPKVSECLSSIILKLLNKNAEDRYQNAFGVYADLEKCLELLQTSGEINIFELGQKDVSGKFLIPQKLYGREEEITTLVDAFERCADGSKELALVTGFSGTGKSALVYESHKAITARKGYFVSGKYEQYKRNVPYYALIESFKELIGILLSENEERLANIRSQIQEAVGEEGKVLTNVLPNLVYIIGEQKNIPDLRGAEVQVRFNYIFTKFIQAVCTAKHPLLLFLDDLQWADSASLTLMENIMTNKEIRHLFLVGAYRNNEVSASHPLNQTIHEIRLSNTYVNLIEIGNLDLNNIIELVSDATGTDKDTAKSLSELILRKTQGNAFFTVKFLKSIANENLVKYDLEDHRWFWDIEQIRRENISENVVEFMSNKIQQLDSEIVNLLKAGACIGNQFDIHLLASVTSHSFENCRKLIFKALVEGLLVELDYQTFKFSHDRIQQAVYSLLSEDENRKFHLQIGELLLKNTSEEELENKVFEIVNQLNQGAELILDFEQRIRLANLNHIAGKKAKTNSAFETSGNYFIKGISMLPADSWKTHYDLSLGLYSEACESSYLCGEFEKMEAFFKIVIENALTVLDKLKSYEVLILGKKAQNNLIGAIDTGLDILEELGEPLPRRPNDFHIYSGLIEIMFKMKRYSMESLLNLPLMTDPYKIAAMRIIADITSSVYWAMPKMTPLVVFKMISISIKYGNNAVSCFAYGSYGVILCGFLGFMKKGNEFGKLSLDLLDKLDAKEWKAQIYVSPYALIFHWNNHVDVTLRPLRESFHIGMETGLIEFACVNTNIYCIHSFLSGKGLKRLEEETRAFSESYKQMKQQTNYKYNEVYRQAMLNFMGKSANPLELVGEAFDEKSMLAQNLERNDKTGTFFILFLRSMLGYYFRDFDQAAEEAEKAQGLLEAVLAKFEIPNHHFYQALAALARIESNPNQKSKLLATAKKRQKAIKKWAVHAPQNFLHKYDLIEAERLNVLSQYDKASLFYEKSIKGASDNGFIHEEALARELAGRFYFSRDLKGLAEYYLRSAYHAYREWGAEGKLLQLEREFIFLFNKLESGSASYSLSPAGILDLAGHNLDIDTFIKSATTISGEVVLSKLLSVLIRNAIENAGAQRGLLLLNQDNKLFLEAVYDLLKDEEELLQHADPFGSGLMAESIVKYVIRTKQRLVLDDAMTNRQFMNDPYIKENRVHAVMCIPIDHQGKNLGLLYLENKSTTAAFTQNRVELLSLLSAQMAISIDNALLYEKLELKVAERTLELTQEKQKSDELLYNILPYETAQEIKKNGKADPQYYEMVSVMFTDFVEFTRISSSMKPDVLVLKLDECFQEFDKIMEKYGIEKIKTIGDAYMAAAGLPVPNSTHAENMVNAAREIREFMINLKKSNNGIGFDLRIGIHTGPVISGIVGRKKFQYDIWGDTVNIASRMETNSQSGRINISQNTYELIKHKFNCEYRGEIEAKGKGKLSMYFVL